MMLLLLAAAALTVREPLYLNELRVCIEDRTKLDPDTLSSLTAELRDIASDSGFSLDLRPCASTANAQVVLTIQSQPALEPTALGAARVSGGRVQPELEVYRDPVALLIGTRLPVMVGRAMGRVAAHELGHYLLQTRHHSDGLMSEVFSAPRLMVKDNSSFRIPLPRTIAKAP